MKQCLSLLRPEMRVLVGEDELDRVEEVGLAGAVTTHHDIVTCMTEKIFVFSLLVIFGDVVNQIACFVVMNQIVFERKMI